MRNIFKHMMLLGAIGMMPLVHVNTAGATAVLDVCAKYGAKMGDTCGTGSDTGLGGVGELQQIVSECTAADAMMGKCTYQNCDGQCKCTYKGKCDLPIIGQLCEDVKCDTNPSWSGIVSTSSGNETGTIQSLNTLICKCENKFVYRCAAGYYNNTELLYLNNYSTTEITTCTHCPQLGTLYGESPAGVSTKITDCYQSPSRTFSDSTGSYQFTTNCKYTK